MYAHGIMASDIEMSSADAEPMASDIEMLSAEAEPNDNKSKFNNIYRIKQRKKMNPKIREDFIKLSKLCDDLKETYDVSLIDNMPDNLIEAFRLENACHDNMRPVLSRLITNYYNKKNPLLNPALLKPVTKFIRGPKNLTIHSSKFFNMRVCIFGENHEQGYCGNETSADPRHMMNIEDYLEKLLQNTDKYLDYLFEVPTIGRRNTQYQGQVTAGYTHLNNILQKFRPCIDPITRHNPACTLGRVHFMDIRTENSYQSDEIAYIWMYCLLANSKTRIINTLNNKLFLKRLNHLYNHGCTSEKQLVAYFSAFIFGNIYNVVELKRLMESESDIDIQMGDRIKDYIKSEILIIVNKYFNNLKFHIKNILFIRRKIVNTGYKHWEHIPPEDRVNTIKSFKYVTSYIIRLVSLGPDLYTLCRMFKTFNLKKAGFSGAYSNDQPKKALNIVIYAGDAHSQRYRRFLRLVGFQEDEKAGQSDDQNITCLDMTDIQQPLFSENFNIKKYIPPNRRYDFNYDIRYDDFTI
jgi:hypothetical protein